MPWVINFDRTYETPEFQLGKLREWSERISDVKTRSNVSQIFKDGGELIEKSLLPKKLELESDVSKLPDAFSSYNGILVVNEDIAEKILELDPTQHQIFPLLVEGSTPSSSEKTWCGINIFAEKTSIIREKSSVKPHFAYKGSWKVAYIDHDAPDRRMLLTPAALEGPNLWREASYPGSMFMSDALKTSFDDAGLVFFNSWHADIETMPIQHRIAKQAG